MTRGPELNVAIRHRLAAPKVHGRSDRWAWLLVLVAAFFLYGISASPHVHWQDAGRYELRVAEGQLIDPEGLCRSHPLHFWISVGAARLLPVTLPMAMSLVSALAGAIAVANVFGILREWTGQWKAALLSAAGLALSHSFWQFSCLPGAHIISTAILTGEFWALLTWDQTRQARWLVLMFFANGIGLANHDLALLSLPVIAVVLLIAMVRRETPWRVAVWSAIAWLVGAAPYLWLVGQHMYSDGPVNALHSALFGNWGAAVAGHGLLATFTVTSIAFTVLSFPNLMLPLAALGLIRGRRIAGRLSYWALLAALAIQLAFVLRYNVINQYTFLLSAYALLAVFSGLGVAWIMRRWTVPARSIVLPLAAVLTVATPLVYVGAYHLCRHYRALGHWARNKPYRDDYRYLLLPWRRGELSAEQMSRQASKLAGRDGLIIAFDGMGIPDIEYQLLLQGKRDVQIAQGIQPSTIVQFVKSERPVVLVPANVDEAPPAPPLGQWRREGDLFILDAHGNLP